MTEKLIALVGRPNVGKSTLFNRLVGSNKAIVHNMPGVTRDRKYAMASIGPLDFRLVDTPGLEEAKKEELEGRMMQQTLTAIREADLVCLVIDNLDGVTAIDKFFANIIRKNCSKSILVVNKCEKNFQADAEFFKLGFGDPVPISAEHGVGMIGLYEEIATHIDNEDEILEAESDVPGGAKRHNANCNANYNANHSANSSANGSASGSASGSDYIKDDQTVKGALAEELHIVITGRPNAGKSTFINSLLQEERLLTGPEAGITRESIEIPLEHKGTRFKLIDTAGLRKRSNVKESLEKLSTGDAIGSINFANTVVLMLDATMALEGQDLTIARYTIDQGRSLVIAVNKWDLIQDKIHYRDEFIYRLEKHLPQVKGVPIAFLSAIKGKNVSEVLDKCIEVYKLWNSKVPTSKLNDWLNFTIEKHPLPLDKKLGRRLRMKYITQISTRPPTFKIFCNLPQAVTDHYKKYLINSMRSDFNLPGVPIRIRFVKSDNPYATKKNVAKKSVAKKSVAKKNGSSR